MGSSYVPLPITTILILILILINLSHIATTQLITDTQFIKTTCQSTPYPHLCLSSLSADAAAIHSSHRLMTVAALNVALTSTRSASSTFMSLAKSNAITPSEGSALIDCIEEFGDSIEELKMAVAELKDNDKTRLNTEDIRTWVSAALTNDDTCMDGFAKDAMNDDVKESVRTLVVNVAQLTSIALSLVSQLK